MKKFPRDRYECLMAILGYLESIDSRKADFYDFCESAYGDRKVAQVILDDLKTVIWFFTSETGGTK
jgi:hypothetical protein